MFFISIDCIKNTGGLKLFFDRCNNDAIGLIPGIISYTNNHKKNKLHISIHTLIFEEIKYLYLLK